LATPRIGKIFHLIHATEDFFPLMEWYDRVFEPRHFVDHKTDSYPYWPVEKRNANLIVIGDTIIEPLSPAKQVEGWDVMPVGRFIQRFGAHWHSIAFYVDDIQAMYDDLRSKDIRVFASGGGAAASALTSDDAIFSHPKDTSGALEFMERIPKNADDPRFLPGWNPSWWSTNHPLGLERLESITVVVNDVERAAATYERVVDARVLAKSESTMTSTRNIYVGIGEDTVIELAQPLEPSSLAGADLAKNGEIMHATTWKVVDLDRAAAHLESNGVAILDRDDVTIVADPAHTFGAIFRFTTRDDLSMPTQ
jgi:hypothetical protein